MAEGFLRSFDPGLEVSSAGTNPAAKVNPFAIKVMKEVGIDLSDRRPRDARDFVNQSFDYVITVCDNAKETCPVFIGQVKHRLHLGFQDPADATGTDDEVAAVFRRVRDEIKETFQQFYSQAISRR
jgi:arsenate reductase